MSSLIIHSRGCWSESTLTVAYSVPHLTMHMLVLLQPSWQIRNHLSLILLSPASNLLSARAVLALPFHFFHTPGSPAPENDTHVVILALITHCSHETSPGSIWHAQPYHLQRRHLTVQRRGTTPSTLRHAHDATRATEAVNRESQLVHHVNETC